ncbi:MAG: hypothetical protein Q8K22_11290 [Rhodoferax sp.]|nr:hypothetical protein [Rhodoferax sp.]
MTTTLTTATPAIKTIRASINERKLFETMGHWFSTSYSVIGEVMQNARRAGATSAVFETNIENRRLEVIDDGCGISDFQDLIKLATSGWEDEQIQLSDKPFGMGFFSLFYACDAVTIRSNGKMFTACLKDIVCKREIHEALDPDPVTKGTRIVLNGLKDKLMETSPAWSPQSQQSVSKWKLDDAIEQRAKGFDIPIILNGVALDQPYARSNLQGQATSVGYVSIQGIHFAPERAITAGYCSTRFFLQGLPIESQSNVGDNIVHLDSERFIALMPDRANLQNSGEQLQLVYEEMKRVMLQFLVEQKQQLSPQDFVGKYYRSAIIFGNERLLNDIPYLPRAAFSCLTYVSYDASETWEQIGTDAGLVSRTELMNGEFKAWQSAPSDTNDGQWAATLLKVMQRESIAALDMGHLHENHWAFQCLPNTLDFRVQVTPHGVQNSVPVYVNCESCDVTLVDSVTIVITSAVNAAFRIEHDLINDWLVVPAEPIDADEIEAYQGLTSMICYFTANDSSPDHACCAFDDFRDEHGNHSDEIESTTIEYWSSLMGGLRGQSLSTLVSAALSDTHFHPTPNQELHLCLVRRVRDWNDFSGKPSKCRFDAINLEAPEFWEAFAGNLGNSEGEMNDLAERLKHAFARTVKPGALVIGDSALSLIHAAGYHLRGQEGQGTLVLLPGETQPNFEATNHNYIGFFNTREEAIEEVVQTVIADTCKWHGLSIEQWEVLDHPQKWTRVRDAHAHHTQSVQS